MIEMYKGAINSPETKLVESINAGATTIKVVDTSVLPVPPNLAVIGIDGSAETIRYSGINENMLVGCERGFQGMARSWEKDTPISRNFTEYDHDAFMENIEEINKEVGTKASSDALEAHKEATEQSIKKVEGNIEEINKEVGTKAELIDGKVNPAQLPADKDTTYTAGTNVTITGTTISAKDTIYDDTALETRITAVENREDKDTTYDVATTTTDGLMSSADKSKLDGVETGAEKNSITSVQGRTGAVTINKSDVGLGSVNNVAITAAQVTKINELNYTRAMTQAQYDALSTTEKNRTDVWYGIYEE